MIPCILCPYIRLFCEKSRRLNKSHGRRCEAAHLDPNGGFSAPMLCTDEANFGIRAGDSQISVVCSAGIEIGRHSCSMDCAIPVLI